MESSEETLIRRLKRTPFDTVLEAWGSVLLEDPSKYLENNGWTWKEFVEERKRRGLQSYEA